MSQPHCVIVTPAPPLSRTGNRNTAVRWAGILRCLGWHVEVTTEWNDGDQAVMIALHARRSRPAMMAWRARHPSRPLLLALTGTDVYRDIHIDADAADSLELADRLVVLQAAALDELTPVQRGKAHVIHQSETPRGPWQPPRRHHLFSVIGHLREEKDPLRGALALGMLPDLPKIRLRQAGAALSPDWATSAEEIMATEPRFRWLGEIPHGRALKLLRESHALIVSSRMEGGAHVVSEAIVHGVPVIASDIPGNRGLLGDDYPAYFPVADTAALAGLLRRAVTDDKLLGQLHEAVIGRQGLFEPAGEVAAWRALLAGLAAI